MKAKFLATMFVACVCALSASARDDYSTNASVLPQQAQTTLSTHFNKAKVNHVKIDKNLFGIEGYDVVLNDGTEVEFDSKGNIKEVDSSTNGKVPDGLILRNIRNYVSTNYPGQKIVKYDVKRSGFEVELQSGVDLEFNKEGTFKRIDR